MCLFCHIWNQTCHWRAQQQGSISLLSRQCIAEHLVRGMEATSARSGTSVKIRQTNLEAFIPCNNNIFPSPVSLCWSGSCPEAMMHSSACLLASPSAPRPQQQHSCLRLLAIFPGSSLQGAWALGWLLSSSTHVLIRHPFMKNCSEQRVTNGCSSMWWYVHEKAEEPRRRRRRSK